jgi:hypothetical protein
MVDDQTGHQFIFTNQGKICVAIIAHGRISYAVNGAPLRRSSASSASP